MDVTVKHNAISTRCWRTHTHTHNTLTHRTQKTARIDRIGHFHPFVLRSTRLFTTADVMMMPNISIMYAIAVGASVDVCVCVVCPTVCYSQIQHSASNLNTNSRIHMLWSCFRFNISMQSKKLIINATRLTARRYVDADTRAYIIKCVEYIDGDACIYMSKSGRLYSSTCLIICVINLHLIVE